MKVCTGCKENKSLGLFGFDKRTFDGLRQRCRDCNNAASNEYKRKHHEEVRMNRKTYNKGHAAEKNARQNAIRRAYRKVHPLQKRVYPMSLLKVPARIRGRMGLPKRYWDALISFYGEVCMYPKCPEVTKLQLDHIVLTTKGGSHTLDNFQILCKHHNASKGNRNSIDYRPEGRRLVCTN
jgi:5-methylcytosine-specific restriction endonuclease McrA